VLSGRGDWQSRPGKQSNKRETGRIALATTVQDGTIATAPTPRITAAAWYALGLLFAANALNYVDRHIVSILAQSIKTDLKLDDADLGFLLGTAFAVFYSVVGIAMGRISDMLPRKKVMAFGLALWSAMTALGGASSSFAMLGVARLGVGVGEAVANPCGHSLVSDIFPQRNRALVLSILLTGVFVGTAGAMVLGGWFLQEWKNVCHAVPIAGACALPGWKAALFGVGLPGLPLALLLLTLREPPRQQSDKSGTFAILFTEFAAALPPFTLLMVWRVGGQRALMRNLALVAVMTVVAGALMYLTGDRAQWAATGLGFYAIVTWAQVQAYRDPPLYRLTFGDPTFQTAVSATALMGTIGGTVGVWAAPYAMRTFGIAPTQLGATLAGVNIVGSLLGVISGGIITDIWKRRDLRAPVGVGAITVIGLVPSIVLMLTATTPTVFFAGSFCLAFFAALWSGSTAAMVQDLVLPRMRGSAAAAYSLIAIVVGSGIGPYWAGKVSKIAGSLNAGLLSVLLLAPIALLLLWLTSRRLPHQTPDVRLACARAAGEPV
jgi:MFS family permease